MADTQTENQPVIDGEALTVTERAHAIAVSGGIGIRRSPAEVLKEAGSAARALMDILQQKKKPVIMNGERYLENDDWQVIGRFHGVSLKTESTTFRVYEVPLPGDPHPQVIIGFDAAVLAVAADGRVVGRAESGCYSDEEKWSARPKYAVRYAKRCKTDAKGHKLRDAKGQFLVEEWFEAGVEPESSELIWIPNPNKPGKNIPLRERVLVGAQNVPLAQMKSMAQTRAGSKVLAMLFRYVPQLAGCAPTPAEEMDMYSGGGPTRSDARDEVVDHETGEILTSPRPDRRASTTAAKTKPAEPAEKKPAPAEKKPAKAPLSDTKPAAKKPKPDTRTPAQRDADETGFGGELPGADAGDEPDFPYLVTAVEKGETRKGMLWKVTYVNRDDQEFIAITDDADIADVCIDSERSRVLCRIVAKAGKLKYPEIEEIEQQA